jgi:hypothetical protein
MLGCYSLVDNDCGGWCQGCSDCPIAAPFHDENAPKKVTRRMMLKYLIKDKIQSLRWKWIFWKHREAIGKIIDEYLEKRDK